MSLNRVKNKYDYNQLMCSYKISDAPLAIKEGAIRKLKASYPQFDTIDKKPTPKILKDIIDGQAELPKVE